MNNDSENQKIVDDLKKLMNFSNDKESFFNLKLNDRILILNVS